MTDATNRKLDVKNSGDGDIARDDPLYELSQIIGFSRPAETSEEQAVSDEQIDLEQEMLREFENYPKSYSRESQEPESEEYFSEAPDPVIADRPAVTNEPENFEAEFERDFGGMFDPPAPSAPEPDAVAQDVEPDAMEAELFQIDPEPRMAAPQPAPAPEPYFSAAPEPAPQQDPDSLEDELLDLLGSLGGKANADWEPEKTPDPQLFVDETSQDEPQAFEEFVERAEFDSPAVEPEPDFEDWAPAPTEATADVPASAPKPFWFDDNEFEPAAESAPVENDADSALLDAFESELSEGLSISLDEMSQEQVEDGGDAEAGFSIEDELDLDRAYEASATDEEAALDDIESAAEEIAAAARPAMPPMLDTAEMPAADIEAMQPLDLPEIPAEEPRHMPSVDIETELNAALSGYAQYSEAEAEAPYGEPEAEPEPDFDIGELEDDLARDMEYVAHDLDAHDDDGPYEDYDDELDVPAAAPLPPEGARSSRGMMIAAVVGGVAVLGAVGAFMLSGGDVTDDGGPVLVRADSEPTKIVPEDPGGKQVPNQDRAVYGEVDGNGETAPTQETLVSTSEEPIDLSAGNAPLPSGVIETAKVEDRLMPDAGEQAAAAQDSGQALLSPRRVRTVIVKPDGTFVPTPQPEPAAADAQPAPRTVETQPAPQVAETASDPQPQAAAEQPAQAVSADESEALQEMAAAGETAPAPAQDTQTSSRSLPTPASIPERPAEQPTQTASAQPAPQPAPQVQPATTATSSGYTVQISSQPSAALAQQSATELSRRFGNLFGGRAITIQQADIEGRGTFHRVRVAASDRQDAVALCEALKRAGGSCFVAR